DGGGLGPPRLGDREERGPDVGPLLDDGHVRVEPHPDVGEVPQHLRLGVGDPHDPAALACRRLGERAGRGQRDLAGDAGDRVPVRVADRVAEQRVDPLDEEGGDGVLEHLGLVVDLVPLVPEVLDAQRLDEPAAADQRPRPLPPPAGERDAAVALVVDQALVGEAPDGLGRRRRRHAHPRGERTHARRRASPLDRRVDRLEVVLGDVGRRKGRGTVPGHRISIHWSQKTNPMRRTTTAYHTVMTRARSWTRKRRSPSRAGRCRPWSPRARMLTTSGIVTVHTTRQYGHSARSWVNAWYWNHVIHTAASTEPTMSATQ